MINSHRLLAVLALYALALAMVAQRGAGAAALVAARRPAGEAPHSLALARATASLRSLGLGAARATPSATRSAGTLRPTARPLVAVPPIYYQDGATVYAVNADGSNRTVVATLPAGATFQPQLLPDGRLLYSAAPGSVAVVDHYGRHEGLQTPDLKPGEVVWSVVPSPDGRTLAWQIFAPAQLGDYTTNAGTSRIALTGRFGEAALTVFSGQASGANGRVPVLLGWRRSSPYSLGGPTLLLQDLYSHGDGKAGVLPNTTRGLLEYDPAIGDLVNDYLPPLEGDIPPERTFSVSTDGLWAVYGDANVVTPSGEGPLARALDALNLNTNVVVPIDDARTYPSTAPFVTTVVRKVGKRTVRRTVTSRLRLYQYFGHHAYMAPGDGRVLYTLLTVSYPPGALVPRVQRSVLVATLGAGSTRASGHTLVAKDAEAAGWLSGHVAVIKRADGLYAVDVVRGGSYELAMGAGAQLIGTR
jgi:hypothetical protein